VITLGTARGSQRTMKIRKGMEEGPGLKEVPNKPLLWNAFVFPSLSQFYLSDRVYGLCPISRERLKTAQIHCIISTHLHDHCELLTGTGLYAALLRTE